MASTVNERNGSNNLPVLFVILEEGGVAPTVGGEDVDDDDVPGKDIHFILTTRFGSSNSHNAFPLINSHQCFEFGFLMCW